MKRLIKVIDMLALILYRISGLLLVMMMLSVVADVAARSLFAVTDGSVDLTFVGGIEVVKYGLLFAMLFAFPHAVDKGQIVVDLFTHKLPASKLRWFDGFYTLCFGVFGALLCWRFFEAAGASAMSGELTQDLLIPLAPMYLVSAVALAVLALRGFSCGIRELLGKKETVTS
ncbi:TRAP transporter small permease [Marinobacterium rhizophilum]|uniref:TRAP transporter small permease protein n=1 Tax=Marinobacterium rhizophilum TaxID=420402 RepID=A0ABY5HFP3_9GAMM|nr:TRAP transporter small permease subunit [Marinobacterium rhizophilum]UTW10085.1 TRAP transporter small permease [Marinobacterium rhizophilum]